MATASAIAWSSIWRNWAAVICPAAQSSRAASKAGGRSRLPT
jgi:hypothetical protein